MIVGIDSNSKSVAVVWWNGHRYSARKFDVWERWSVESAPWFRRIMARLYGNINLHPNDHVFIEAPVVAGARNIQSTVKQSMVNGILQEVTGAYGVTPVLVSPSTWKQTAVGTGGASKEQVLAAVRLNIEYLANEHERDQDVIDAAAICIHGRSVVEGLEALRVV